MTTELSAAQSFASYLEDGTRIAAILLVWGVISAVFTYGVSDAGIPFESFWLQLGQLFALTGVLNAGLYVLYRTVDHWHRAG